MNAHVLFAALDADQTALLKSTIERLSLEAGDQVIRQYDTSDSLFLVEAGEVLVASDGVEVARLGVGAVLGEVGLFTQAVRTASVRTTTPSVLLRLTRDGYDRLRDADHPVAHRIERRTIRQLRARLDVPIIALQSLAGGSRTLRRSMLLEPASGVEVPLSTTATSALLGTAATFSTQDRRAQRRLAPGALLRVFAPGEMITELDVPSLHVLIAGAIDGWADLADRREDKVRGASIAPGQVFGVGRLLPGEHRRLIWIAREPVSVLTLDPARATSTLKRDNSAGSALRQAVLASLVAQHESAQGLHDEAVVTATLDPDAPQRNPLVREGPEGELWDAWFDL